MIARPPRLSPTDTRFPYTALFRAAFGKKAHHCAARKAQGHRLGRVTNRMAPPPRQKDSARAGHQPAYDGPLAHVVFRDERHAAHAVQHEDIDPRNVIRHPQRGASRAWPAHHSGFYLATDLPYKRPAARDWKSV